MQLSCHPNPQCLFLWTQSHVSYLSNTTTLCPIPRSLPCLPLPKGFICIPGQFRKNINNFRKSRRHRFLHPQAFPTSYLRVNGPPSTHTPLQCSEKIPDWPHTKILTSFIAGDTQHLVPYLDLASQTYPQINQTYVTLYLTIAIPKWYN